MFRKLESIMNVMVILELENCCRWIDTLQSELSVFSGKKMTLLSQKSTLIEYKVI